MNRLYFTLQVALLSATQIIAAPSVKVAPAALTFNFQEGSANLPPAQTLSIAALSGVPPTIVNIATGGSQWLICSPQSGKTPFSVSVSVNPTSLPIGQFTEVITFTTPLTGGDAVNVVVTLNVKPAPSDLRVSPASLTFVYRLGDAAPTPMSALLTTTGGMLSFSAAPTGAKWMRVSPSTGAVFPGFRTAVGVNIDVSDLVPGTQKGTLTITSTDAITKTISIPVILTVQPGQPVANSIWPPRVTVGAPDTTFTITGDRFYSGTSVRNGMTILKSSTLGPNALNVIIPASLLANPGTIPLVVANPDPGGGLTPALNLDVLPPGPLVLATVNAASQLPVMVAPGGLLTIYGSGLGPDPIAVFDGTTPTLPTSMGGTLVYLAGVPLPIVYASSRQVSVSLPNTLALDQSFPLEVEYNGVRSSQVQIASTFASPGIFTSNGSGTGNIAAFQLDPVKGTVTLNSDKAPAVKGNILTIYATGIAPIAPIPPDGYVAIDASPASIPGISVSLGDIPAEILYSGYAPGLVTGIVQINLRVPDNAPIGKAVPVSIRAGSGASQPGATLNVK